MILAIDTTQHEAVVALKNAQEAIVISRDRNLFSALDKILLKTGLTFRDVTKIIVNRGPGYFTTTRTGVICANTLSFLFRIPIAGVSVVRSDIHDRIRQVLFWGKRQKATNKPILPLYNKPPTITKP